MFSEQLGRSSSFIMWETWILGLESLLTSHGVLNKPLLWGFLHLEKAEWCTLRSKKSYYRENCSYCEVQDLTSHLGDSAEDVEGRACPSKGSWRYVVAFPLSKEAVCSGIWCAIHWVSHLPVRRAVAFLFLPRSCECGSIPYYWGLTSIDHLMIPAIHCGPTNSLRQKEIKEKMDQCFPEERVAAA